VDFLGLLQKSNSCLCGALDGFSTSHTAYAQVV